MSEIPGLTPADGEEPDRAAEFERARLSRIEKHLREHRDVHEDDGWWLIEQAEELARLRDERTTTP